MLQNSHGSSASQDRRWSHSNPPPTSPRKQVKSPLSGNSKSPLSGNSNDNGNTRSQAEFDDLMSPPMSPNGDTLTGTGRRWSIMQMLTSPFRSTSRSRNDRRQSTDSRNGSELKMHEDTLPVSAADAMFPPALSSRANSTLSPPLLRVKSRKTFNPLYRKSVKGQGVQGGGEKAPRPPPRPSLKYKNNKAKGKSFKGGKSFKKSFKGKKAPQEPQAKQIIPPSKEVLDILNEINALPSTEVLNQNQVAVVAPVERTVSQRQMRQPTGRWKGQADARKSAIMQPSLSSKSDDDAGSSYDNTADGEILVAEGEDTTRRPAKAAFNRAKSVRLANRPLPTAPRSRQNSSQRSRQNSRQNSSGASGNNGQTRANSRKKRQASVKHMQRGTSVKGINRRESVKFAKGRPGSVKHGGLGGGGGGGDDTDNMNRSASVRGGHGLTLQSSYPEDVAQQKPHGSSNGGGGGRGFAGRNARSIKGRQSCKGRPQSFKGGRPQHTHTNNDDDDNGATKLQFLPSKSNSEKQPKEPKEPKEDRRDRRRTSNLDHRNVSTASSTDEDFFADREQARSDRQHQKNRNRKHQQKHQKQQQQQQQQQQSQPLVFTFNAEENELQPRALTINRVRTLDGGGPKNHPLTHASLTEGSEQQEAIQLQHQHQPPRQKPKRSGTGRWNGKKGAATNTNNKPTQHSNNNDSTLDNRNDSSGSDIVSKTRISRNRAGTGKFAVNKNNNGKIVNHNNPASSQHAEQRTEDDMGNAGKKDISRKRAGTGRFGQSKGNEGNKGKTSKRNARQQQQQQESSNDDGTELVRQKVLESSLILADEAWAELAEYRELDENDVAHDSQLNVDEGSLDTIPSWRVEQITYKKEEELAGMTNPQRLRYLKQVREQKRQQQRIEQLIRDPSNSCQDEDEC